MKFKVTVELEEGLKYTVEAFSTFEENIISGTFEKLTEKLKSQAAGAAESAITTLIDALLSTGFLIRYEEDGIKKIVRVDNINELPELARAQLDKNIRAYREQKKAGNK